MLNRIYILALLAVSPAWAAESPTPQTGPAVDGFGPVYAVPEGSFNLSNDRHYNVSKDLSSSSDNPGEINRGLDSVARFLNMQARNGTPSDQLDMAVIVHGGAGKDMLNDDAYNKRFGLNNPNAGLLAGLQAAGVKIYLCGQTAAHRGYAPDELNPAVSLALSAMAAHVQLQSEGYTLIPF
jgi:intracellular sulfur oxidation DsrE/DsrF family protein